MKQKMYEKLDILFVYIYDINYHNIVENIDKIVVTILLILELLKQKWNHKKFQMIIHLKSNYVKGKNDYYGNRNIMDCDWKLWILKCLNICYEIL